MIGYITASDGKRFPLNYLMRINESYIDNIIEEQPNIRDLVIEKDDGMYLACTGTEKINFIFLNCLESKCTFKVEYTPKLLKYEQFN
jgi:hypothetical protein